LADEVSARPHGQYVAATGRAGDRRSRSFDGRYMWRHNADVRAFALEAGLGGIAGQAMRATEVRFYFDHLFIKEPETDQPTPWHQDLPYWPFSGQQVCSAWVALTANDVDSSALEFVRGSHLSGKRYRPTVFIDDKADWIGASDDQACPDIESARDRYDIVSFAVEPGDALLFSAHILHAAPGNRSATDRRVAISLRFLGDDATWDPRPGTDPIVTQTDVRVQPGELARDDDAFPVVYRAGRDSVTDRQRSR
jgi:ectoine hydroxylase-related dioxygenase (phytanoyl-CoA dioxygenase family)